MSKFFPHIARIFLGSILVVAVVARVIAPQLVASADFPPAARAWLDIMQATGYMQGLLYLTEFVCGAALLANIFVPLAIVALIPITLNIALFHIFLDPRFVRIVLILLMLSSHLLLVYENRRSFVHLFQQLEATRSKSIVGSLRLQTLLRIFLGSILTIAGGAKLLIPDRLSVGDFLIDGMKATGYLYSLLGFTELACGLMLTIGKFIPLVLMILAPIVFNILLYHLFLAPKGLVFGLFLLLIYLGLVSARSRAYHFLFRLKASAGTNI
jgi:putative oxidoreductase